jgi:hypothetical protein
MIIFRAKQEHVTTTIGKFVTVDEMAARTTSDKDHLKIGVLMYRVLPGVGVEAIQIEWLVLEITLHSMKLPIILQFVQMPLL